ncbi:hypothetical protein [Clostera anachoreta granulovirus]|uniref:Uncharacterized protein n=1 Tax=Clostera anachoreta granulovirus TaxID=283675 RepID=E7CU95_9BBAC|nr:hypothetical protein ClanGV_gp010 [Clostera anachoreta granulovirus]ADU24592.1 unknown [Clostera anachoreta granulovirus]AEB00298.1 hypothetical protein [Clostera anachoreta granulovirus]
MQQEQVYNFDVIGDDAYCRELSPIFDQPYVININGYECTHDDAMQFVVKPRENKEPLTEELYSALKGVYKMELEMVADRQFDDYMMAYAQNEGNDPFVAYVSTKPLDVGCLNYDVTRFVLRPKYTYKNEPAYPCPSHWFLPEKNCDCSKTITILTYQASDELSKKFGLSKITLTQADDVFVMSKETMSKNGLTYFLAKALEYACFNYFINKSEMDMHVSIFKESKLSQLRKLL